MINMESNSKNKTKMNIKHFLMIRKEMKRNLHKKSINNSMMIGEERKINHC